MQKQHLVELFLHKYMAEKVGFEPTQRVNALRDFESRLFDHLSTSPYFDYLIISYNSKKSIEKLDFFANRLTFYLA